MRHERDGQAKARVFDSKEERDQWQIQQYGRVRNAFRTEDDPIDERPLLYHPVPFWSSESERLEYEHAVEGNPIGAAEPGTAYCRRIAAIVERRIGSPPKSFPRPMSRAQRDARLQELRAQEVRLPYREDE